METLESLRRRIESAEDLLSVVKTMKALAAANIRQYQRSTVALTEYNRTIEMALQVTLRYRPAAVQQAEEASAPLSQSQADEQVGAVVFGSDQGLCGQFNERIAEYTLNTLNGLHIHHRHRSLLSVGRRVTSRLQSAHQPIEDAFTLPGSVHGIGPEVRALLVRVQTWRTERNISRILLFYNRSLSDAVYSPQHVQIFPIDLDWLAQLTVAPWPSHVMPVIFSDWQPLFRALIQQYFFVALYRAFAESMASENASRLASMQAAQRNIEDHLRDYSAAYQQQRQQAITSELLDIVGGFEALTQP